MSGIQKHNKKTWSDYERFATHVYDEKFLLKIFQNVREHEQQFLCETDSALQTSNCYVGHWKSERNYVSRDSNNYYLTADFVASETGDYSIEVLYRTSVEGTFPTIWYVDGNKSDPHFKALNIVQDILSPIISKKEIIRLK